MGLSWQRVVDRYQPDAERHRETCAHELGLDCPFEVFRQLFHEQRADREFGDVCRSVDWAGVGSSDKALFGNQLQQVGWER
jgi:hypothetical protein